jgi:glycosyltransferase involved in cell wall biosynthesis
LRILMYSHDSYGLGHLRRTLALAEAFVEHDPGVSVLILTGSTLSHTFRMSRGIDIVKLPAAVKVANGLGKLAANAERWALSNADAVLAVSIPLRDYAVLLGAEPDRVHVVPNGVDAELFQPGEPDPEVRTRRDLGDGPILGFVGGLRPWHGVEVLPALLERLVRRHPNLHLVIAGDGPLRGELERDLRERGLAQSVVFTGWLPHEEVAALIRHFDVALAPYPMPDHDFYFSPLKLFEYMACGVPVVAARLGQIEEVVRNGETGLLYPPGEFGALDAACSRLLEDPDLRWRMGRASAKEAHDRYTWDHNAARVVELARSLNAVRGLDA